MSQQVAKSRANSSISELEMAGASWSYGWYLFEDGKVVGPLQADDAFNRGEKTSTGQMRMVSRKGFTQWYPLSDFAELHLMAGKYADQLANAKQRAMSASPTHGFAEHQPVAKTLGPSTMASPSGSSDPTTKIRLASQDILEKKSPLAMEGLTRKEKKRLKQQERRLQKDNHPAQGVGANAPESKGQQQRVFTFEDQYLLVASRLRLGQQKSPFVAGFVYFPLTAGGYWGAWLSRASEELTWHLAGSSRVNFVLPMWMALIPGVHLVFAWMLARLLSEVEMQNGYRTISPVFSTILAVFPPLYIQLIQGAMNRHWRLHVYHSMDRQANARQQQL